MVRASVDRAQIAGLHWPESDYSELMNVINWFF